MKVKEFIHQLEQLDQEKNIWTIYDSFSVSEPEIEVVTEEICPLGEAHGQQGRKDKQWKRLNQ